MSWYKYKCLGLTGQSDWCSSQKHCMGGNQSGYSVILKSSVSPSKKTGIHG